ncbi:hypothetical protein SDC9_89725 [bioreactor metagenome]|uniref:Uncharacterized protein n=1 Tax=bioreactor metagenome TaxID=1076179 RepID=A0A644ZQB6_9ZZZZ
MVDAHCLDAEVGEEQTACHMLGGMHLHEAIAVLPVQRNGYSLPFLKGRVLNVVVDGMLIVLGCVEQGTTSDFSPVSALSSPFGVTDGPVKNDAFVSYGYNGCFQAGEIGLFIVYGI